MKKNTKQFQKGWQQLSLKYRQWEDLQVKGRMKMKKKRNKQGKQYYDFDFSRYQYYYSYPQDHIGMAPPSVQKQFINRLLQRFTQNPSIKYHQTQYSTWRDLQNILKPLQLHQFLRDMSNQLAHKMSSLRIEKCLRIKKMKSVFGPQSQIQKSSIQLLQTQIRSLCHKKIRIDNKYCQFGKPLQQRLKDLKSYLKSRPFDEYQFSELTKGDFMVLMRLRYVRQALSFNSQILVKVVSNLLQRQEGKFYNKVMQIKAQKIYTKRQAYIKQKRQLAQKVISKITQKQPNHFDDNADSKQKLQTLLQQLDFIKCLSHNIQQIQSQKIVSQIYSSLRINYEQYTYIPKTQAEVKDRLVGKIGYYFNKRLIEEGVVNGSEEHVCYKVNNLCFLQLKVLWQSYNYAHKKQQSSLFKIRSMMHKQLQLVYSHNIDNLLNIRQHSIKAPTNQSYIPNLLYSYKPQTQKQQIMTSEMKVQNRFKDPLICSFIALLGCNKDVLVKDEIQRYTRRVIEGSGRLWEFRRVYYQNVCGDDKTHVVNVLNKNISVKKNQQNPFTALYIKTLQQIQPNQVIDYNYFRSYYMLLFLRCSQLRYQILQVLNAQLMCMIKSQSRIKMLWKKSKIPFEMSKEFIERFIDPVESAGETVFKFTNSQVSQDHIDGVFKQMYNEDADKDYINWKAQIGIQVRRRRSENPLLQGKSVIYEQAKQYLQSSLTRIEFLCSQVIKNRQIFLFECKLTQIVDRLELLFQFLDYEHKFQRAKARLLDLYTEQLVRSTCADGIRVIYEEMSRIVGCNEIVDLTQGHFGGCYRAETEYLEKKVDILALLIQKQTKFQQQFCASTFNEYRHQNFGPTQPQISSMYYSQQITIQHDTQIIQQAAQDQSESLNSDSQSNLNTKIQGMSEISSVVDAGSQYHLKTSFQEILSKNSVGKIKEENNKKEEIMNKKKQKVINDSLLGLIIPKTKTQSTKVQFFYSSYIAIQIIKSIDQMLADYNNFPKNQIKALFLQEVFQTVQNYSFKTYKNLIRPEQLTVCLNNGFKIINKIIQKSKNPQALSSRAASEHWLAINSKVIENIITSTTGQQIDQFRGLYLCLNATHINQINFKTQQIELIQSTRHSEYKSFKLVTQQCSPQQAPTIQYPLQQPSYLQKRPSCLYKLATQLKQSGQCSQLAIGNYTNYYKAISAYDYATNNLIATFNRIFYYMVGEADALQGELKVIEKYQCCGSSFGVLAGIPGIENRVNLRKRIEAIGTYKKKIIPKQLSVAIIDVLDACTRHIPKIRKIDSRINLNQMANNCYQFQLYIAQITKSSILIAMLAQQLCCQLVQKPQLKSVKKCLQICPLVQKHLSLTFQSNQILLNIFNQYREEIMRQSKVGAGLAKEIKLTISEDKISVQRILDYVLGATETIERWVRDQCVSRKREEFSGDVQKSKILRYYDRHFPANYDENQPQLQIKIQPFMKDTQKLRTIVTLRQWFQSQSLIFGSSLNEQQLIKYRKMLINPLLNFPIFWQNNQKHLIGPRQLSKLKTSNLDAKDIITNYKQHYLTYSHLKKAYKNFIEDLYQFQFDQEYGDIFLVLYSGAKNFFNCNPGRRDWDFLVQFCDPFANRLKSDVDLMCQFINDYFTAKAIRKSRFFRLQSQKKNFNLDQLKYELWNSQNKSKVQKLDETRRFIKQRLNQCKSLAYKPIKDQVALPFYRNQKLNQILHFLKIDFKEHSLTLQDYRQNFDRYVHQGLAILNTKQLFIFNMTEKSIQTKGQLIRTKQDVMKTIMNNQFMCKLIRQKLYSMSSKLLDNQLCLRKILLQDLHNQQASKENKILKQTINKILVPKVKLNPFLSSPLKIQNHFFAGSIKLSFIDQFLNKLRNRAVMIQLAEGGTGYLLKVNQLDQSIQVLCKSIIGFSEKEFADRFRTVFDVVDQLKEANSKLSQQNKTYKAIIKTMKEYQGRQIKTMLYQKLNDYLVSFYQHQKFHNVTINLLKTIQNKMNIQINNKFKQKLAYYEYQNKQLRQKLQKLKKDVGQIIKSNSNEARDVLFNSFREKAESVLNKHFIDEIPTSENFEAVENQDSEILLRRLMMQKSFYEMKIAKIQGSYSQKISSLQKKILEQNKLQNLLIMEQQKNKNLAKQVKQLQKCSIQNQLLKKQMNKKQQQQTMQKFRLVKINQSLKGKLKRIQQQATQTSQAQKLHQQSQSNPKVNTSVQVSTDKPSSSKKNPRSFHIKTQSNMSSSLIDVGVWKDKWVRTEKRYAGLLAGVRKVYEYGTFTRNFGKIVERLGELLTEFEGKKLDG